MTTQTTKKSAIKKSAIKKSAIKKSAIKKSAIKKSAIKGDYITNGVILQENDNVVVIATGLDKESENTKTGAMIQIYFLYRHESPAAAVWSGNDEFVCFDCPHRLTEVMVDGEIVWRRRCYVNLVQGPSAVFDAYSRGRYRRVTLEDFETMISGRMVRFGAYGEPVLLERSKVEGITAAAAGWTGYTHQWRRPEYQWFKRFLMASCDNEKDVTDAVAMGWRYFRVAPYGDTTKLKGEISCPASKEAGAVTTCSRCSLCNGARENDKRKNITIQDHSTIKRTAPLVNIQGVK
jgi:hypothetical protein